MLVLASDQVPVVNMGLTSVWYCNKNVIYRKSSRQAIGYNEFKIVFREIQMIS